jgi:hypothetical protein
LYLCQPCNDPSASGGKPLQHGNVKVNTLNQPNKLTVIVFNNAIYLYVNNNPGIMLDGSAITSSGEIGLYATLQNESSMISFSEVKVWELTRSG